jgi:rod shape determining protein RodA
MSYHTFSNRPETLANTCAKIWKQLRLDTPLLIGLLILIIYGLIILYSSSDKNLPLVEHQILCISLALFFMFLIAQISPHRYMAWTPGIFVVIVLMLAAVLGMGVVSNGAQRWLNLGIIRFQPSEIMKIAMPLMLAWYLNNKKLPLSWKTLFVAGIILFIPVIFIAKQPDLGTAIVVAMTGIFVILLAGIRWRIFVTIFSLFAITTPIVWHFMHTYQKNRILIFLNPEHDPLRSGYNIIQSKIAIGSGGIFGKGLLHGSQVHLQFLPTHTTDFIFAVCCEELGFIGCLALIAIFLYIVGRCLYITSRCQDTFTRLLAGSLTLTFFAAFFINIGMVIGLLPVVGIPLPLVSYGGSSVITLAMAFGIIMSIHTHRKLISC